MNTAKKLSLCAALALAAAASLASPQEANACSNILVTAGASADGSNMISYAADSHQLYGELYYLRGGFWDADATRDIVDWDSGKFLGRIPQVPVTYQRVGNMNEKQLIIGETTYGGRSELWDTTGLIDYGSLIYIALERCSTAREAIETITGLANTYGYCSEGESFSIADQDEVWVMDLIGKGTKIENGVNVRKGVIWVARRVPDGYICAHANQARISTFPLDDPENCLYAPDVISFAREMGWFKGKDSEFSFCDTYAPLDFSGMRACEARAWSAFNILCKGQFTFIDDKGNEVTRPATDFLPYAMGRDKKKRFPLFVKPAEKVTVKDVADAMRDHFEGTPMDMTTDIGAGGNALPYRWRPMEWEVNGKKYINERAMATQQTGFWFVGQSRGWLPDTIGALLWFGCDDAATSWLSPIYVCTKEVPECFHEGNGDILHYSATSAFWMCNRVANACYKAYNIMAPTVREAVDEWENRQIVEVQKADSAAYKIYSSEIQLKPKFLRRNETVRPQYDRVPETREYLTQFSVNTAQEMFAKWTEMEEYLLVKFLDGNVKAQNPDGSWVTNGYSDKIPDKIGWPGYTEKWKKAVVKDNGKTLRER